MSVNEVNLIEKKINEKTVDKTILDNIDTTIISVYFTNIERQT